MLEALFVALSFLMLLSPVLLGMAVALVMHTVVAMARGHKPRATVLWGKLSLTGACVAMAMYGSGLWSGGFFYFADPADLCGLKGYGYSPASSSMWPLHNTECLDESGRVDLVPAFVNPLIYLGIGLCAAGIVGLIISWRRQAHVERAALP